MITIGLILFVVGLVLGIGVLETLGIVLLAIGIILLLFGSLGHPIGRNHYW
jgi:hypothetical protein